MSNDKGYGFDIELNENLNEIEPAGTSAKDRLYRYNGNASGGCDVDVHFRNIQSALCDFIYTSSALFGCVAWLTNKKILKILSMPPIVSIIIQKERFWLNGKGDTTLQKAYRNIQQSAYPCDLPHINKMSFPDDDFDAIRCVGNFNSQNNMSHPRMHNKFLVSCKTGWVEDQSRDAGRSLKFYPRRVWTGSFNFSKNATNSLENAVIIHDENIAQAYMNEWAHIFSLSEPINWEHETIKPEFGMEKTD